MPNLALGCSERNLACPPFRLLHARLRALIAYILMKKLSRPSASGHAALPSSSRHRVVFTVSARHAANMTSSLPSFTRQFIASALATPPPTLRVFLDTERAASATKRESALAPLCRPCQHQEEHSSKTSSTLNICVCVVSLMRPAVHLQDCKVAPAKHPTSRTNRALHFSTMLPHAAPGTPSLSGADRSRRIHRPSSLGEFVFPLTFSWNTSRRVTIVCTLLLSQTCLHSCMR